MKTIAEFARDIEDEARNRAGAVGDGVRLKITYSRYRGRHSFEAAVAVKPPRKRDRLVRACGVTADLAIEALAIKLGIAC